MNNNNRNNNRRRGRGNNRGSGGGNQSNRIDSRARGNAPQLLEKYKKLAHDASLNDDRVQTEYYLQFADHYFRVIADNKAQKDEQRARRDAERDPSSEDEDEDDRQEARGRHDNRGRRNRDDDDSGSDEGQHAAESDDGDDASDDDNPFTRDTRPRAPRTRSRRKPANDAATDSGGIDAGALPPAISRSDDDDAEEKKPAKPRTRSRRARPAEDGDGEALEAVN